MGLVSGTTTAVGFPLVFADGAAPLVSAVVFIPGAPPIIIIPGWPLVGIMPNTKTEQTHTINNCKATGCTNRLNRKQKYL
jgi:hypothetical protein